MKLGKLLRKVALLTPLLKLFGVKDKTVAAKVGKGLVIVEGAVNEKEKGIVIIELLIVCIILAPVAIALFM